jgi:hypothetical protein
LSDFVVRFFEEREGYASRETPASNVGKPDFRARDD